MRDGFDNANAVPGIPAVLNRGYRRGSRPQRRLHGCTLLLPLLTWTAGAAAADAASAISSQAFPTRPIRLISPFAPGGGNDILSRTLGAAMSKGLGQSIVVDNRPGANTIVAMEILAHAAPDGYTLLTTSSSQASNATLYANLPYDSIKSFAPVSRIGVSPLIVAVNPALPINSVRDLIAAAKAKPGAIQGPRPRLAGPDVGTPARGVQHRALRAAPCQDGPAARAGGDIGRALGVGADAADGGRIRHPRL
jgi:hypothetical protein